MNTDLRMGEWIIRPRRRVIERNNKTVHLKPKSMAVFEALVAAGGTPVSRSDLIETVWRGAEVSDDALTQCIVELRKAFGDDARESRVIETIPRLGFRLIPPTESLTEDRVPQQRSSGPGKSPLVALWQRHRIAGLSLAAVSLILVVTLSFNSARSWLTETGMTLFLKTAGFLSPDRQRQSPGLAVLPFVNFSGDPENEYFSDGMSVEIINTLARANRLPVIARSSSFAFKGVQKNVKEIGRELGVTHVLEGSVRRSGQNMRLTVQLIDATEGTHVWSGVFQRELSDVFALQNEIANEIVDQIYLTFGDRIAASDVPIPGSIIRSLPGTSNLDAYDLYLQGMQKLHSPNPMTIEQAAGYFDRAIALDGDYADAWAAKGLAHYALGRPGFGHPHIPAEVYPHAIAAFRKALDIEPEHPMATGWLGVALIVSEFRWAEGMQMMEASLARNPNDAELLAVYGSHLGFMGMDGAEDTLYAAFRLDPNNLINIFMRIGVLVKRGQTLEALAMMEDILEHHPEGYFPNFQVAAMNLLLGRLTEAEVHIERAREFAHPKDLTLDSMQWIIDRRRGEYSEPAIATQLRRSKTERLSFFVDRGLLAEWEDAETIVAAFNLAIEQRHPEVRRMMFQPKPSLMPEEEWRRMKEITGVTAFQRDSQVQSPAPALTRKQAYRGLS
jgi:TolB-like protein/DNA-binding winged helix-turn-helix (wHTH) protein/Tfp pilus assembly protein PilF